MTYHDLEVIKFQLDAWMAERHLDHEAQQKGVIGNILEELAEVARAANDDEKVGEICDIVVFCLNAQKKLLTAEKAVELAQWAKIENSPSEILNAIAYTSQGDFLLNRSNNLDFVVFSCFANIERLGYDPFAAMSETMIYPTIGAKRGREPYRVLDI